MTPLVEPHTTGSEEQMKVVEGDEPVATNVDIEAGKYYGTPLMGNGRQHLTGSPRV